MATYKEIKGVTVQTLDSDPVINAGTWSTGGSMNTGRQSPYSNGTQSAAWAAAGYTTTNVTLNEHYNGTAWTEVADLNSARHGSTGGAGTTTAGLVCGGDQYPSPRQIALTETWDGSSWTEVSDMNTARAGNQIVGQTYTAALTGGGLSNNGNTYEAKTEKWDGTSWTETGDLNTARWGIQGAGTSTAASFNGGDNPSGNNIGNLEQFDGSSWTETTDSNNVRRLGGSSINSTYNDFIVFGGHIGEPETTGTATEFWNGSAWTELNDLGTAESNLGGAGTSSSGLSFAGTPQISQTEEWTTTPSALFQKIIEGQLFFNSTSNAFKVTEKNIPGATWASGGDLNTARGFLSTGIGTQTAAAVTAGYFSPPTTYYGNTEEYDGSSWTESGDLPSGRYQGMAGGTQTAGIYAGGYSGSWPAHSETFYYNGTSWSDQSADLNTARDGLKGTGLQTAAIAAGGISGPGSPADDEVELWDGSSWTETTELNTARYSTNMSGTSTDALMAPGASSPGNQFVVETWDGTSWTEVSDLNTNRINVMNTNAPAGASAGTLIFGGQAQPPGSNVAVTEIWNGSSWTEIGDLSTARRSGSGFGSTGIALATGGITTTYVATTEEFTAGLANFTITSS
jgi:hypothetical protein